MVTNDTFAALQGLARAGRSRRKGPASQRRGGSSRAGRVRPLAGGRWSLVAELVDPAVTPTERAHGQALVLLERYGIVARATAQAEEVPGGFGAIYRVLKTLEEAGRVRRGHFVTGLAGAQFALPGAVECLRAAREDARAQHAPQALVVGAADPANPWGLLLPWPETTGDARPRRVAGALVVAVGGRPVLYLGANRRSLTTFRTVADAGRTSGLAGSGVARGSLEIALEALRALPGPRRRARSLVLEKLDGIGARETPLAGALRAQGFVLDYRGWVALDRPRGG